MHCCYCCFCRNHVQYGNTHKSLCSSIATEFWNFNLIFKQFFPAIHFYSRLILSVVIVGVFIHDGNSCSFQSVAFNPRFIWFACNDVRCIKCRLVVPLDLSPFVDLTLQQECQSQKCWCLFWFVKPTCCCYLLTLFRVDINSSFFLAVAKVCIRLLFFWNGLLQCDDALNLLCELWLVWMPPIQSRQEHVSHRNTCSRDQDATNSLERGQMPFAIFVFIRFSFLFRNVCLFFVDARSLWNFSCVLLSRDLSRHCVLLL